MAGRIIAELGGALLSNGKRAAKSALKNGSNGNGVIRNGAEALTEGNLAKQAFVEQTVAKKAAQSKPEVLIEAGAAETVLPPSKDYAQEQVYIRNRRRPGAGSLRANRAGKRKAAHSVIMSDSIAIQQAYPNEWNSIRAEVESWNRGGYAYARDITTGTLDEPLKGYPNWIGPDGKRWRLKSKGRYGQGYRLSGVDTGKLKSYGTKRASRENPWTNEDEMEQLMKALAKYGKAHKFAKLKKIMIDDFNKGMDSIPKGYSKGHLVSLDDGGIDVAENFVPQLLRNTRQKIDGKWIVVKGNAAMQADSTDLLIGEGVRSWDEYVRLKLSQL